MGTRGGDQGWGPVQWWGPGVGTRGGDQWWGPGVGTRGGVSGGDQGWGPGVGTSGAVVGTKKFQEILNVLKNIGNIYCNFRDSSIREGKG